MAKQSGLGAGFAIGGYSIPGDIQSVTMRGGPTPLDVTGIDKSAFERIGGIFDAGLDFVSYMNDAAARSFTVLKTLPTTDTQVMYFDASALDAEVYCLTVKQLNYDATRGTDGSLTFATTTQISAGASGEWCDMLTAGLRTDTGATNGSSIDGGVATTTGWSAYLQVTAFTGTSITLTLEDSANNSTFAAVTGGAFTAVTAAPNVQRIEGAAGATLRQYVRITSSGTFNPCSFFAAVTRHPTGATG